MSTLGSRRLVHQTLRRDERPEAGRYGRSGVPHRCRILAIFHVASGLAGNGAFHTIRRNLFCETGVNSFLN